MVHKITRLTALEYKHAFWCSLVIVGFSVIVLLAYGVMEHPIGRLIGHIPPPPSTRGAVRPALPAKPTTPARKTTRRAVPTCLTQQSCRTAQASSSSSKSAAPLRTAAAPSSGEFPAFGKASFPFSRTPNWGVMHSSKEWNRTYDQMNDTDFVAIPAYDMNALTTPLSILQASKQTPDVVATITAKLFYSTRYYSAYDIDSDEYTWEHPGVDLKVAKGTPVAAIGGGRVVDVSENANLGIHVIIEHHTDDEGIVFSIYGHLASASVQTGDDVVSGTVIGQVGMTGNTVSPHLHLQIDRDTGDLPHVPFWPKNTPTVREASQWTVHPIAFIAQHQ